MPKTSGNMKFQLLPRCVMKVVLALGLLGVVSAQNDGIFNFKADDEERHFEKAECVFDAGLAVFFLMRAGLEVTAASKSCPRDIRAACTMDVAGAIASFGDALTYFLNVASECPPVYVTSKVRCAADIARLTSSIAELVAGSAGIAENCVKDKEKEDSEIEEGDIANRRLQSLNFSSRRLDASGRHPMSRAQEVAECVVDTSQSTLFLGKAGLDLAGAVKNCHIKFEALDCASEISGVVAALSFVASYLASAVSECGTDPNPKAFCASDISKIVASLAEISEATTGMAQSCAPHKDEKELEELKERSDRHAAEGDWIFGYGRDIEPVTDLDDADGDWVFGYGGERNGDTVKSSVAKQARAATGTLGNVAKSGLQLLADERKVLTSFITSGEWNEDTVVDLIKKYPSRGLIHPNRTTIDEEGVQSRMDRLNQVRSALYSPNHLLSKYISV